MWVKCFEQQGCHDALTSSLSSSLFSKLEFCHKALKQNEDSLINKKQGNKQLNSSFKRNRNKADFIFQSQQPEDQWSCKRSPDILA